MITQADLTFAEHIIDSSDAVNILADGMRNARGPQPNRRHLRALLIGMFLGICHHGRGTVTEAHRVLTKGLPHSARVRLGVVTPDGSGGWTTMDIEALFRWSKRITHRLGYTVETHPELDDAERARRELVIRDYCDAVMDVFNFAASSTTFALDATGLHAWAVARHSSNPDDETADEVDAAEVTAEAAAPVDEPEAPDDLIEGGDDDEAAIAEGGRRFRRGTNAFDADAAWGYRSGRNGEQSRFFGFHEHTLVQVPDSSHADPDTEPRLIRRFAITPANADVVGPSLMLIDRLGAPMTDLIADSHYHYKAYERWKAELDRRGVRQHHDLRVDEIGFVEFERMRWVGGYAHCPATSDSLDRLARPGFTATRKTKEAFYGTIEFRKAWAMQRHTQPDLTGTHRVVCPALAGKVGCPLRDGTVAAAIELGLPVVEHPPNPETDGEPLPKCCTQRTVKVTPPERILKLQQPHYWASREWDDVWKLRSFVESTYGNRKNVSNENMRRGNTRIAGLAFLHVALALTNASYNLRMVRNWQDRTGLGDETHPLLAVDDGPDAWEYVSPASSEPEAA
jgi:hypothetical protein